MAAEQREHNVLKHGVSVAEAVLEMDDRALHAVASDVLRAICNGSKGAQDNAEGARESENSHHHEPKLCLLHLP